MLRGNYPAKVDTKGRLKIPSAFMGTLQDYGDEFFVTSENGDHVRVYPMRVWSAIEEKLARLSSHNATKQKFLMRTSYFGQAVKLDGQGRLLIPPVLRGLAASGITVVVACPPPQSIPGREGMFASLCEAAAWVFRVIRAGDKDGAVVIACTKPTTGTWTWEPQIGMIAPRRWW